MVCGWGARVEDAIEGGVKGPGRVGPSCTCTRLDGACARVAVPTALRLTGCVALTATRRTTRWPPPLYHAAGGTSLAIVRPAPHLAPLGLAARGVRCRRRRRRGARPPQPPQPLSWQPDGAAAAHKQQQLEQRGGRRRPPPPPGTRRLGMPQMPPHAACGQAAAPAGWHAGVPWGGRTRATRLGRWRWWWRHTQGARSECPLASGSGCPGDRRLQGAYDHPDFSAPHTCRVPPRPLVQDSRGKGHGVLAGAGQRTDAASTRVPPPRAGATALPATHGQSAFPECVIDVPGTPLLGSPTTRCCQHKLRRRRWGGRGRGSKAANLCHGGQAAAVAGHRRG